MTRTVNGTGHLAGGARKERIVDKYGEISNWDVSNVHDMFVEATSFNHALHAPWYVVEQSESE